MTDEAYMVRAMKLGQRKALQTRLGQGINEVAQLGANLEGLDIDRDAPVEVKRAFMDLVTALKNWQMDVSEKYHRQFDAVLKESKGRT